MMTIIIITITRIWVILLICPYLMKIGRGQGRAGVGGGGGGGGGGGVEGEQEKSVR